MTEVITDGHHLAGVEQTAEHIVKWSDSVARLLVNKARSASNDQIAWEMVSAIFTLFDPKFPEGVPNLDVLKQVVSLRRDARFTANDQDRRTIQSQIRGVIKGLPEEELDILQPYLALTTHIYETTAFIHRPNTRI